MPFSENIKQSVKERAHFKCCLCHKYWVADVHHIKPEAEGDPDTEDNAAPLCANCHDLYGGNPEKRKFIRENRDFWYAMCEKESPPDFGMIHEIREHIKKEVLTKQDLDNALRPLYNILSQNLSPSERLQQISVVTSAISDAIVGPPFVICPECQLRYDMDASKCPNCGWPESGWH